MSFNRQERINIFFLFLREGFLFPFLIIFLNALQVAVLHVDGDAVEIYVWLIKVMTKLRFHKAKHVSFKEESSPP